MTTPARGAVGIVASAGGVEPLRELIAALHPGLPVAVLVVLHISPRGPSVLPEILGRVTTLEVRNPVDGEVLSAGVVLVAPPDRHLEVVDGRARVGAGPRLNGHRPSADKLLESLAPLGERAAAVVLSGTMDDGAAGLLAVHGGGGLTMVQDPEESLFGGMPRAAIGIAPPDLVGRVAELAERINRWAAGLTDPLRPEEAPASPGDPPGAPATVTAFTCPDCGGTLWAEVRDGLERYRCRVGHTYTPAALAAGKDEAIEQALWAAVVALEERADLDERLARRMTHSAARSERYSSDAAASHQRARVLRALIEEVVVRPAAAEEPGA